MKLSKNPLKYAHWLIPAFVSWMMLIPVISYGQDFLFLTNSRDANAHIAFISSISWTSLVPPNMLYWGRVILGYPMALLHFITNIEYSTLFLWLGAASIIGSVFTLYIVFSKLVNRIAGVSALFFAVLGAKGILSLYITSVIFELINLYIILPIGMLVMILWLTTHRQKYLWGSVIIFGIFSIFHVSGLYLTPVMALFVVMALLYKRDLLYLKYGLAVIGMNLLLVLVLSPSRLLPVADMATNLLSSGKVTVEPTDTSIVSYLSYYLPVGIPIVLAASLTGIGLFWRRLRISEANYLVSMFVLSFIIVLGVAIITQASIAPVRMLFALVSMIAIFTAISIGVLAKYKRECHGIG